MTPVPAHAHGGGHGHHHGMGGGGFGGYPGGFGGSAVYLSSYYPAIGTFNPLFGPAWSWWSPVPMGGMAPGIAPVGGPMPVAPLSRPKVVPVRRTEPAKSAQLVTIGDRLFRAGNSKRAADRYEQAKRLNPDAAAPLVHLAQIALVRGDYAQAAERFREAVAAEPEFLAHAPNIAAVYAEPADFRKQLSKLESRVLVEPGDRDAWLVLGAELFLSGQTKRAADVFLRLTDRRPDPTLAAFLDASTPLPAEK